MTEPAWVAGVVVIPLVGALVAVLAGRRAAPIAVVTAVGAAVAAAALVRQIARDGVVEHAVGGWAAPLGIALRADGLSALFVAAVAVVGTAAIVYALAHPGTPHRFHAAWLLGWAGLAALAVSADAFNLYVALELLTLAGATLVALSSEAAALRAALRYILLALAGSLAYLFGVVLLYAAHATLELSALGAAVTPGPVTAVAIAAMVAGLALKSALFPLHGWLPPAYAGAPAASAVVLAGLLGKASFLVLVRLWFEVVPPSLRPDAGLLLGVLGAAGALWGAVLALRQTRLRRLLAYSSVGQLGYLFLVFPLGTGPALAGAVYLVLAHAAAKAALFMAAGSIERACGSDELGALRGLAPRMPLTFLTIGLAGLTLMGLPPSGGFVAKWLLLGASLETGQWWWAIVLVVGGFLAAAYVFRVLRLAFLPAAGAAAIARAPRGAELPALALALVSLGLGLAAAPPLALLGAGP